MARCTPVLQLLPANHLQKIKEDEGSARVYYHHVIALVLDELGGIHCTKV